MYLIIRNSLERNFRKLMMFGAVGALGTVVNFTIYYCAFNLAHFGINISAIFAFMVAVINNYLLNHIWTFRVENRYQPVSFKLFISYLIGNLQGLGINLIALNLIVIFAGVKYHLLGQMIGIFLGMLSNFIYTKKFVFKMGKFKG